MRRVGMMESICTVSNGSVAMMKLPTAMMRRRRPRLPLPYAATSRSRNAGKVMPAARAGATTAMYVTLRLPLEIKDLFREWLADARPDRAARVMSLIHQTRGGKDYDADWSQRMKGIGPVAELIAARFKAAVKRYGLDAPRHQLDETRFRVPASARSQLDLFDVP